MPQQPPPQSPQPDQPTPPSSTPESTGASPSQPTGRSTPPGGAPGPPGVRAAAGLCRGADAGERSGVRLGRLRTGRRAARASLPRPVLRARGRRPGTGRPFRRRRTGRALRRCRPADRCRHRQVRHRHTRRRPRRRPRPPRTAEPKKRDLTVNKVIAGAGAAATSAVLGSFFGAMGTVGGAALGSVFSAVVTWLYAALAGQDARHGQGPHQASRRGHGEGGEHDRGARAARRPADQAPRRGCSSRRVISRPRSCPRCPRSTRAAEVPAPAAGDDRVHRRGVRDRHAGDHRDRAGQGLAAEHEQ